MNNITNIIRTAFAILALIVATGNITHAGTPPSKSAVTKQVNPNFDPNKKLVNKRSEPLLNRDRQAGESILNTNRDPLFNRKYVPKKYTKAQYYK
jgi:hypothetical protein